MLAMGTLIEGADLFAGRVNAFPCSEESVSLHLLLSAVRSSHSTLDPGASCVGVELIRSDWNIQDKVVQDYTTRRKPVGVFSLPSPPPSCLRWYNRCLSSQGDGSYLCL